VQKPQGTAQATRYLLSLERSGDARRFVLRDLERGESRRFASWEALRRHLEDFPTRRLK
jgi:hypothetical protein